MSRLLYRRQRALVHVLLWSTVDGLPAMFSGLLVATALDRGFLRHRTVIGLAWLAGLGVAALVRAAAVRRLFPWLAAVVEPLRDELVTSIVTTTLRKAVAGEPADLASVARLTGQVETVRDLVSATLRTVRQVAVTITAALIGLFVLAPAAALICLPPVLAALALYAALLPRLARREYAVLLAEERIAGDAGSALVALRDVVACGAEGRVAATIGSHVDAGAVAARSLARASGAQRMVVAVGGEVPLLMVLALSPWLMHRAGLTAGDAAGAATYLGANLLPAMRTLVETLGVWGLQLAIVGRRLAEAAVWPADPPRVPPALQRPTGYELRLEHASFAYGLRSDPIIHELDLLVPEDDHLAIVGPSGIGKSTLADIISGGIAPTTGDVLLGGTSLTRVDSSTIRHNLALLPQEAYVFAGSLRENLTYLCGVCSDRDLDAAVETLGLRQLVNRLGGYDAQIDSLSNGERQLIALARVWLSPARIVILDEATAHLDLATEAVVEEAFARRFGTLIVVAHRISSARRARRVLLMEDGRLSSGSVESHARSSRLYEQMVRQWQLGPAIGSA
ncbi:MAG: ABC transporter ATP-binding protein [Solirubrobacterales bacterium]|nr:ABC transporter ATP-binding protein [Solirubrobacterales bacterium]